MGLSTCGIGQDRGGSGQRGEEERKEGGWDGRGEEQSGERQGERSRRSSLRNDRFLYDNGSRVDRRPTFSNR